MSDERASMYAALAFDGFVDADETKRVTLWAAEEIERLQALVKETVQAARDFNRGAMTWKEYDRKLVALERSAAS